MSSRALVSIIDDDAGAREGIRDLVASLGYRAVAFETAQSFLDSDNIEETACIITDLQMPGLNGFDLQQLLHAKEQNLPIIFVTAYPEERHRVRAMSSGAVGFLAKPFEEQALIDCLALAVIRAKEPRPRPGGV